MTFFDLSRETVENRIIFSIQHPAHVHLFRNAIKDLADEGYEVYVFAREKDINIDLLEQYDIPHTVLAGQPESVLDLGIIEATYEYRLTKAAMKIRPSVFVAMGGVAISRPAMVTGARSLVLTDTEHATLQNSLSFPFADRILTPECYQDDIGSKQLRYPGYHELAYLHPNRFEPDESILDEIDADQEDSLVILRLVSWDAAHDIGDSGFEDVEAVVDELESTGARVLITSEADLPQVLESKRTTIPPHRMHDLMYYSDLFIGESSTMAAEAAILGTPAIYASTIKLGYTEELEKEYEIVFNYSGKLRQTDAIRRAICILTNYDRSEWMQKRQQILKDKIDTTELITDQISNIVSKGNRNRKH